MSTDLEIRRNTALKVMPSSYEQLYKYSKVVAKTQMVPNCYKNKPDDCFVAMQFGLELGLNPLYALQNIAVINGRPSIYGDALIALVRSSPLCEYIKEGFDENQRAAYCKVKRKEEPEHIEWFSEEDAKRIGKLNSSVVWKQYPKRMMKMRARGFALRDVFADLLGGLISREEAEDTIQVNVQTRDLENTNEKNIAQDKDETILNQEDLSRKNALVNTLKDEGVHDYLSEEDINYLADEEFSEADLLRIYEETTERAKEAKKKEAEEEAFMMMPESL